MFWKIATGTISFIFIIFMVGGIFVYFLPFETTYFVPQSFGSKNYNFSVDGNEGMQFYENLRYRDKRISYRIENVCNLNRKTDMEGAFQILEDETVLDFYPVETDEEIFVTCEDKIKVEERFFVAGEGGPTNITKTDRFNVILHGGILLLKNNDCERPNVATHELLHALGFDHSANRNNIMNNISKCGQTLGEDIPNAINNLYSIESFADLSFENVSASMDGKYLNLNISVRNYGLRDAGESSLVVYADSKEIKNSEISPIKIGHGWTITIGNLFVSQIKVEELKVEIVSNFGELDKENNNATLQVKGKS